MRCHHHNEPRVQLDVPKEETFPIPLKYIDVRRSILTDLDVMQEKRVDDYWNLDPNISVFTLSCCTHTFCGVRTLRVHFAHSYACYTHAWLKAQEGLQCECRHLSVISPSPFSCFTRPCSCCSLTATSRPFLTSTTSLTFPSTTSCRTFPT